MEIILFSAPWYCSEKLSWSISSESEGADSFSIKTLFCSSLILCTKDINRKVRAKGRQKYFFGTNIWHLTFVKKGNKTSEKTCKNIFMKTVSASSLVLLISLSLLESLVKEGELGVREPDTLQAGLLQLVVDSLVLQPDLSSLRDSQADLTPAKGQNCQI